MIEYILAFFSFCIGYLLARINKLENKLFNIETIIFEIKERLIKNQLKQNRIFELVFEKNLVKINKIIKKGKR